MIRARPPRLKTAGQIIVVDALLSGCRRCDRLWSTRSTRCAPLAAGSSAPRGRLHHDRDDTMARDRSGLKHRRRREPPSAAERAEFRADKIFSRDPKRPMTEAEEEAFYQACEKWCGILLRIGFLAYSLFGLLAALFEWSTRPPMRFDPPGGLAGTNVVVTGGCDGIGLETARLPARAPPSAWDVVPTAPTSTPTPFSSPPGPRPRPPPRGRTPTPWVSRPPAGPRPVPR